MQRLRLTEDFAIEFGSLSAHTFATAGEVSKQSNNSPIYVVRNPYDESNASRPKVLILNDDNSMTNNVREISALDRNLSTKAMLKLNAPTAGEVHGTSYTDCIKADFNEFVVENVLTGVYNSVQYTKCKLYAVAGFNWKPEVAGIWLKVAQTIEGVEYQLCNKCIMRYQGAPYAFKPNNASAVVLDNEQFASSIDFEILNLDYIAQTNVAGINEVRKAIFGDVHAATFAFSANIDISIGFIYTNDIKTFQAETIASGTLTTFNEFALREVKTAPLLGSESSQLYASMQLIERASGSKLQIQMLNREMTLDAFIAQQHIVDAAQIDYDIIVSPFNQAGELIESQAAHVVLSNASNPTSPVQFVPTVDDSDDIATKPYMCMIQVTATLTMQNALGDLRFARSTQLLLSTEQLAKLCWPSAPQLSFVTQEVIHKKVINKTIVEQTGGNALPSVVQIKVPNFIHVQHIVVNDDNLPEAASQTFACPKGLTYNVALQFVDTNSNIVELSNAKFIAKSSKGVIKDAQQRSSNLVEFALTNTEGKQTTWTIQTDNNQFICQIILQA